MGAPAVAPAPRPTAPPRHKAPPRRSPSPGRTAAPRRAPSRPSTARRAPARTPALAGAALIPSAAARTAGAVRDLSDSSLIVRLTRGRGWIAVLCALLGGIVALNVVSLSLNAGSGRISRQIDELERSNSALRASLAEQLSASEVEAAAAGLGLATPDPTDVGYLTAEDSDVDRLARLLRNDTVLTDSVTEAPAQAESIASGEPASAAPAAQADATPPSQPQSSSPPASGGGSGGVGL